MTKTILGRGGFGIVILGEMGRSGKFWKRKSGTLVAVKQLQATGTKAENKKLALVCDQVTGIHIPMLDSDTHP